MCVCKRERARELVGVQHLLDCSAGGRAANFPERLEGRRTTPPGTVYKLLNSCRTKVGQWRVCIDVTFMPEHAPLAGLTGKTSSKMASFNRGSCENATITNDYRLKLNAVGLDGESFSLSKNM